MGYWGIPSNKYGFMGLFLGIIGSFGWATQFIWDWYGITNIDKALYSVLILIVLLLACATIFVANRQNNTRKTLTKTPMQTIFRITVLGFIGISLIVLILNGVAIQMSTSYNDYSQNNEGFFTGFRQLTSVTAEDVNSLQQWALGVRQIVRAMFLVVPCLIATWGGLSVLTADSIDEAEGGILSIISAFVVFIVVWIFKAIDVSLMFMTLSVNILTFNPSIPILLI